MPAIRRAGWDEMVHVREEVCFTKGRIIVRGKLVTESLHDFTKNALRKRFASRGMGLSFEYPTAFRNVIF